MPDHWCSAGCGRRCECFRDGDLWCTNSRPFCGSPDCRAKIAKARSSTSTASPVATTTRAQTFVAAVPPRSFAVNTLPTCSVPECGRTCFEGNAICSGETCQVAHGLLRHHTIIEVTDGVCWSCKRNLGHGGCTDQRHKRMFKMLRNNGCVRIVNPTPTRTSFAVPTHQPAYNNNNNNDRCPGYFMQVPAHGFTGPTFVTPGVGPTVSALGPAATRVRIPGVGDMMVARNPPVAPVREIERIVMYDPLQAMAFAHARGQDPARVLLRMQQQGSYLF